MEADTAYYHRVDERTWRPSRHVQGAWNPGEQHMAPVAGLLAHALAEHEPRPELTLCRISYEILGLIPLADSTVTTTTLRPGRTIELVEATLQAVDRTAVRATGWRLLRADTAAAAGGEPDRLPAPGELEPWGHDYWGGGFIESVEVRVRDHPTDGGRRQAWIRSAVPLVDDGSARLQAEFLRLVDTANGIASRLDPARWIFPNTDLQLHLWRTPEPTDGWVGLDTTATIGPDGVGLTHTVLHDAHGPLGRAAQILTVRPR